MRDRRRWLLLALPIVIGLVIRLWYLWGVQRNVCPPPSWETSVPLPSRCPGDSYVYHYGADLLAQGKGFVIPTDYRVSGGLVAKAGADHPPLFTMVLAAFSFIGAKSWLWHEHVVIALGALNIFLTGLLGRRVARRFSDDRGAQWVGFVAAMFMAVYPYVWLSDVMVLSETLAMTANLAVALLCYRVLRDQSWGWIVALGAAAGAAALVRAEMVLLGPLLILPMVLRIKALSFRQQAARIAVAGVAMLAVLAPWLYRNMTDLQQPGHHVDGHRHHAGQHQLRRHLLRVGCRLLVAGVHRSAALEPARRTSCGPPTRPSSGSGSISPGSTCRPTPPVRRWSTPCWPTRQTADQSDDEVFLRAVGMDYLKDNLDRLPVVTAARLGRMWGLYRPVQQLTLEDSEGRPEDAARFGLVMFYPLMALAVGGTVVLARRREPLLPLLVPVGIVTFAAVSAFGQSRYRAPAEPLMMVLAAVGLMAFIGWVRRREGGDDRDPGVPEPAPSTPVDG